MGVNILGAISVTLLTVRLTVPSNEAERSVKLASLLLHCVQNMQLAYMDRLTTIIRFFDLCLRYMRLIVENISRSRCWLRKNAHVN